MIMVIMMMINLTLMTYDVSHGAPKTNKQNFTSE